MAAAFWFTFQIKDRRFPIPLVLVLPVALLLDLLALVALCVVGIWKRKALLPRIGMGFYLSKLTLGLILWGGRFRIGIRDQQQLLRIHGGWSYS